jgi:hypothetical protein
MAQEGAVPLPSHFRERTRGTCIVDGEGHSVPDDREGSRGSGEAYVGCEIRGIRRTGRSGAEVVNLAARGPGNVEGRTGVLGSRSKDKRVVDCSGFRQVKPSRPVLAQGQRIVGNRDNPEQT